MLFRFDRAALYGPIVKKGTLYPADEKPKGVIGRSVLAVIDDPSAGEWILRLGFDQAKLPVSARPAAVRVVRHSLLGWKDVPAHLLKNADGQHSLFIRLDREEAVYAVVLGARTEAAPLDHMILRELKRYGAWLQAESGVDARASLPSEDLAAIAGTLGVRLDGIRIIGARSGTKAGGVLHGLLKFFDRSPKGFSRVATVEETIYLLGKHLLRSDASRPELIGALADGMWRVHRWRAAKRTYLRDWANQLLSHSLKSHPVEREVRKKVAEVLQKLVASPQ